MTSYDRGTIVLVRFVVADETGAKQRPVLILSTPQFHAGRHEVVVAALTSNVGRVLVGDHSTRQYGNHRADVSHQPIRQRERRFTSAAHLQRVASVHGVVQHLFRVGRHLLCAVHHRLLRTRSLGIWDEVTGAC